MPMLHLVRYLSLSSLDSNDVLAGPDGRSRGFGTVSFATEADAERAVRMFNG